MGVSRRKERWRLLSANALGCGSVASAGPPLVSETPCFVAHMYEVADLRQKHPSGEADIK